MYYDTGHFTTYGNKWGIVTAGSGLARIFDSLELSSPPQPEIYNTNKIFQNFVLIHFSVIIIYNAYLKVGVSKLCCKAFFLYIDSVCKTCFQHHHLTRPVRIISPVRDRPSFSKTNIRLATESNSLMLCTVSSGYTLLLKHKQEIKALPTLQW